MYRVAQGHGIAGYDYYVERQSEAGNWWFVDGSVSRTREQAIEKMRELAAEGRIDI